MTETDELCRLLDERGVEYTQANATGGTLFIVVTSEEYYFILVRDNDAGIEMWSQDLTPEQAIAATLGPRITGETSDGYHTFNELYHHRAVLFSVIVRDHNELAWKSKLHHDGTMYEGMFIVGIDTPKGQATYHYDVDPYWDMFDCKELERAPEWDGHSPDDAIERISTLRGGDSYTREDVEGAFVSGYSLGLDMFDHSKPDGEKGWNENERNLDEEMEELGWVRKEAAAIGSSSCSNSEQAAKDSDGRGECRMDYLCDGYLYFRSYWCRECDERFAYRLIGHDDALPKHCPNCGAKVVNE